MASRGTDRPAPTEEINLLLGIDAASEVQGQLEILLDAGRATLDRLLIRAREAHRRQAATRPGRLLRAQTPIRTAWTESTPGYLEMDTVALCGAALDDRHGWRFDAVATVSPPPCNLKQRRVPTPRPGSLVCCFPSSLFGDSQTGRCPTRRWPSCAACSNCANNPWTPRKVSL